MDAVSTYLRITASVLKFPPPCTVFSPAWLFPVSLFWPQKLTGRGFSQMYAWPLVVRLWLRVGGKQKKRKNLFGRSGHMDFRTSRLRGSLKGNLRGVGHLLGTLLCSYLGNCQFCYRTDLGGGGERYTITKWTHPCAPGVTHPVLGSPCPPPGKNISQCQRLVKRKGIMYLRSYTNLRVMT